MRFLFVLAVVAFVLSNVCWCLVWFGVSRAARSLAAAEQQARDRARRAEEALRVAQAQAARAAEGWDSALNNNLRVITKLAKERIARRREAVH